MLSPYVDLMTFTEGAIYEFIEKYRKVSDSLP